MSSGERVAVAQVSEIGEGAAKVVAAIGRAIAIWKHDGTLYAIDDCCPHRGGSLGEGDLEPGGQVACPLHGWTFDLRTGCMPGPATLRVPVYPVTVEGDRIYVGPPILAEER